MAIESSAHREASHPIRVMVIEDHDHVRWGLMKLIVGEWPRMALTSALRMVQNVAPERHFPIANRESSRRLNPIVGLIQMRSRARYRRRLQMDAQARGAANT